MCFICPKILNIPTINFTNFAACAIVQHVYIVKNGRKSQQGSASG